MKKVLIVDDEPEMVALVALVLDGLDVTLLTAYDGERALEIAREEQPQLIVSDVMMPRLDGWELCRRVKSDPATAGAWVVLMSAMRSLNAGGCRADALISKPFNIEEMQGIVGRLLAGAS